MNIKLIALVLLLDLGLVLSVSYFHTEAYPIIQENTELVESSGAIQANTLANADKSKRSLKEGALVGGATVTTTSWNQSLFLKDLMMGFAALCVINGLLVVLIRKMGASEIQED
ncbi:hypothetical protein D770_07325 [Flammeovirgaceae bacterium 311]|nr:hypothetical protein D770_07325 [Flammeovirgaceae bacterium 311]